MTDADRSPTRKRRAGRSSPRARLVRTLREQVVVNEGGQRKKITKLEASVKQLANKAASGDLGALRQLFMLVDTVEQRAQETATPITQLDAADQEVIKGMLKRFHDSLRNEVDQ